MTCFQSSTLVDQHIAMAKSLNSTDPYAKVRQINQFYRNKKQSTSQNQLTCGRSRYAVIDVIILIAVIGACGFLVYPYIEALVHKAVELGREVVDVMEEEMVEVPMVLGCVGLGVLLSSIAIVAITMYIDSQCDRPGCRGLRNSAEFDIQLETEECVKKSTWLAKDFYKKGLIELPRDHHRELEAELKKIAPPNGRAVLVFRAKCGCSIGRLEVPGPKKSRKVKK